MYIQLTTRCNMECAHCCFSATRQGEDMPMDTLKKALSLASSYGDFITLGGGEPTVHPKFWEMVGVVLGSADTEYPPLIVTNGKKTKTALQLAALAKRGVLQVDLSQDGYHDPIDNVVINAFKVDRRFRGYDSGSTTDLRGIRNVEERIISVGRAIKTNVGFEEGCACEDLTIAPDGTIYSCGCKTRSFGTVFEPQIPDWWCMDYAHSGPEELEEAA